MKGYFIMTVKNRKRLADIEAKYDVSLNYYDVINFVINDRIEYSYYKFPIVVGQDDKNNRYTQKRYIYGKTRKDYNKMVKNNGHKRFDDIIYTKSSIGVINNDKPFSTIKNKLSAYWACGYEIDIYKTNIAGNSFKELNIVMD